MKVDKTVSQETRNIAIGVLILSVLMQAIFLIIGKWDYRVLLGNLLGGIGAVLNFFLMGLTIQSAILSDEKDRKTKVKTSQILRMQLLFVIALLGAILECFNIIAVLVPLFFPRIVITLRAFSQNKEQINGGENNE